MGENTDGAGRRDDFLTEEEPKLLAEVGEEIDKLKRETNEPAPYNLAPAKVGVDGVLKAYGLAAAPIAEDDAGLWAAALAEYWPGPDHPRLNVEGLRFSVGGELGLLGADAPRRWVFERVGPERLRARPVDRFPTTPLPRLLSDRTIYPERRIQVSAPSRGREEAKVFSAVQSGPRAGYGTVKVWRRRAGGPWTETDEVVGGYRS